MSDVEMEVWEVLHRHIQTIFTHDVEGYAATTSEELGLYEWYVTPHRLDGLDFHNFMIENRWDGADANFRYDLLQPRLQLYGDTAIVSYTFMFSLSSDGEITHRTHNESRVLVKMDDGWKVVHVHKSPTWRVPHEPS